MIPPTEDVVSEYGVNVTKGERRVRPHRQLRIERGTGQSLNDAVDNGQLTQAEADAANQQ